MAAYTKGTQSPALNTSRKKEPLKIGTTVTQLQQPMQSGGQIGGQIGQSFGRMIGGDSGVRRMTAGAGMGGGMPGMGSLEAASMRLADAASRRSISEKEAESNIQAKAAGYMDLDDMQRGFREKWRKDEERMSEEEYEKKQLAEGKRKIGGRWYQAYK